MKTIQNNSKQFKTIQKLLLVVLFLTISFTSFYACKKTKNEIKETATFEKLSINNDFVNLLKLDTHFLNNISNLEGALTIINSKKQDKESIAKLVNYLGFKSVEEINAFMKQHDYLKQNLNSKFDFESLTPNENQILRNQTAAFISNDFRINQDFNANLNKFAVLPTGGDETGPSCSQRRSNCQVSASAIYTLEGLACIATAGGIGAGTFGAGGVLFYTACTAASLAHYNSMLNDCNYAYEDCLDKTKA